MLNCYSSAGASGTLVVSRVCTRSHRATTTRIAGTLSFHYSVSWIRKETCTPKATLPQQSCGSRPVDILCSRNWHTTHGLSAPNSTYAVVIRYAGALCTRVARCS